MTLPAGLRRLLREARSYALTARGERGAGKRVLIFAQGRTGSTLLESLLASTGHFESQGEVLKTRNLKVRRPGRFVRGLALAKPNRNFICHVKLYHLTEYRERAGRVPVEPRAFLQELREAGWQIVYLRRENIVRHVLSNLTAKARNQYHKRDDGPVTTRVAVERADFLGRVERRRLLAREEHRALTGIDHLELVYERDLQDPGRHQATADRVLERLGLEPRPARTDLRRINARPVRDIVSNYEDLADWAREPELGSWLKE